jgi:hypothetical protein
MNSDELQAFADLLGERIVSGFCERLPRAFLAEQDKYMDEKITRVAEEGRRATEAAIRAAESTVFQMEAHDREVARREQETQDKILRLRSEMTARRNGLFAGGSHNSETETEPVADPVHEN